MIVRNPSGYGLNPSFIFMSTLGAVFLAELFVMFFMTLLPNFSPAVEAFLDACILSVLVVPFLYILLFKPIQNTIKARILEADERNKLR